MVLDIVRANALAVRELIPVDLRRLIDSQETDNSTILMEWETRKGFVALEVGTRSYALTYVPDDLDGTQWGTQGSMIQLDKLRHKIAGIMPAFDKVRIETATVLLFNKAGRFYTEEAWPVPPGATGPWDMRNSSAFRRIEGGAVLVETQQPWGVPFLIL